MNLSPQMKRILVIIAISLIIILLSKSLLGRAVKNLSIETQKKQQAKKTQQATVLPASSPELTGTVAESAPANVSASESR